MKRTSFGHTSARYALPMAGWLSLGWLLWENGRELVQRPEPLENQRIFLYRIDKPVLLPLRPNAYHARISTQLVSEQEEELRGRNSRMYGVLVEALDANGTVLRQWPAWFRGRHSELVPLEEAELRHDSLDVTVDLAGLSAFELRVSSLGSPGGRLLVAAWEELPLTELEAAEELESLSFEQRRVFAKSTSPVPWQNLEASEKEAAAQSRWQRLAAAGHDGIDYQVEAVRLNPYRQSWEEASFDENTLRIGQSVAWNLRGPCSLLLQTDPTDRSGLVLGADQEAGFNEWAKKAFQLKVVSTQLLSEEGIPDEKPAEVTTSTGDGEWSVEVPPGMIASVHLQRDGTGPPLVPITTRLSTEAGHNPVWGRGPTEPLAAGGYRVSPDLVALAAWRAGPEPLEFAIPEGGHLVRVTARIPMMEPTAIGAISFTAELSGSATSATASASQTEIPASSYERYRQGPSLRAWPSEPLVRYYRLPPGSNHLKIMAAVPMDFSVAIDASRVVPPQRLLGFTWYDTLSVRSRYEPHDLEPWDLLVPEGEEALVLADRYTRVDGIVRLENKEPAQQALPTHTIDPVGRPLSRGLADPSAPSNPAWTEADRTHLPADVTLSRGRELQLQWQVPREKIGVMAQLLVDGAPSGRIPVYTPAGRIRFDDLPEGKHVLSIEGVEGNFWVNAPGSGTHQRMRKVWSMAGGLSVVGQVVADEYAVVHARIFANTPTVRIRWQIDDGLPTLLSGFFERLTVASGDVTLVAGMVRAHWVDEDATSLYDLGVLRVELGEDLPVGPHSVRMEVLEGQGVWASFNATHAPARAPSWQNWQEGVP